ncbi:SRP54, partial [Symbiodinium necroappetens]
MVKMDEMELGDFATNFKRDEKIDRFVEEHSLSEAARCRLVELRVRRKAEQDEDLRKLAQHLCICADRSFTAISLVKKVVQGRIDDFPDMTRAGAIAERFQLDEASLRKLRDIVEKRAEDLAVVLAHLEEVLAAAYSPSATLVK